MNGQPSVTVVIPAYNMDDCICRAIRSVLRQTHLPQEIVVVDDGSTDNTRSAANKFGGLVRVIDQCRSGAAQARNAGIRASNSEIIAFLDADDEWLETKLEKQLDLHKRQDLVLSFCRSNEFDVDGHDLGDTFRGLRPLRGDDVWRNLLAINFIATPTVMASRQTLIAAGGFNSSLKVGEDQDMWIRLALLGPVDFIDESLVRVHMRPASLSSSGFHDQVAFTLPMIWGHLQALKPRLCDREIRAIYAARLGRVGRNACAHREFVLGLSLMAKAIGMGDSPFHNLHHLAGLTPPIRWLRTVMRQSLGATAGKGPAVVAPGRETP
jgi:glycosyltransferase involved in cell wall biosynthesis